jgi:ferredoxin
MKNIIFYFSGTGNSLKVAKDLAEKIKDTELIRITSDTNYKKDLNSYDRIGFVFPVYAWGPPLLVNVFTEKLNIPKDKYVFAVTTCGGIPAATLVYFKNLLEKKGINLSFGQNVRMPGNFLPLYGARPIKSQEKMFKKESGSIEKISNSILENKKSEPVKSFFLLNWLGSFIYNSSINRLKEMDKIFWANDSCTSCSICEKVCPVKNIKIVDGKPVWLNKCEQCMACVQWCPVSSIQVGKISPKRKRYHHPEINVNEFIRQ